MSQRARLDYHDVDPMLTRTFTPMQIAFAALVVCAFSTLTYLDKVSGDATIALVSGITGAILAAPLGARAAHEEGRANGITEGIEAASQSRSAEPR